MNQRNRLLTMFVIILFCVAVEVIILGTLGVGPGKTIKEDTKREIAMEQVLVDCMLSYTDEQLTMIRGAYVDRRYTIDYADESKESCTVTFFIPEETVFPFLVYQYDNATDQWNLERYVWEEVDEF